MVLCGPRSPGQREDVARLADFAVHLSACQQSIALWRARYRKRRTCSIQVHGDKGCGEFERSLAVRIWCRQSPSLPCNCRRVPSVAARGKTCSVLVPVFGSTWRRLALCLRAMNASPRMRDGGERRYIAFNFKHFREMLLKDIDQAALDNAAETLLPTAAPDYRNRKVYTPVIAILRQALGDKCPTFRRPKGSKGTERKGFMWPEDAFDVIDEAEKDDPEFGLYLFSLLYTGIRKSEGLDALKVDMRPEDLALWLRDSKNGDPRMLRLRQDIADRFQTHLKTLPEGRERLFRFRDGGTFQTQAAARHDGRLWPTVPQAPADRVEAAGIPAALRDLPYLPSHLGDLDAHVRRR